MKTMMLSQQRPVTGFTFAAPKQQMARSRRQLVLRNATAAAAPPASGEIKDKNAELAINGMCLNMFGGIVA